MNVSSLPGLPLVLLASATAIAVGVAGLLAVFASAIASVPGFRATDDTRNAAVRGLCAALNLGALLAFAWSQNVVIPRAALPALVTTVIGMTGVAHFAYVGGKLIVSIVAGPSTASITPAGSAALAAMSNTPYTPPASVLTSVTATSFTPVDPALLASIQSQAPAPQGASSATTDAPTLPATPAVLASVPTPAPTA